MEELFLGPLAVGEELDVVDHQHVGVAVAVAEVVQAAELDGLDEVVDERLAGQVEDAGLLLAGQHRVADRLEQVRLAQAHAAVDEQGVVGLAGRLADGQAGRVGQAVARAGDEVVEGVLLDERERFAGQARWEILAGLDFIGQGAEADRNQVAGRGLRGGNEGLEAVLVEVAFLGGVGDDDFELAAGERAGRRLSNQPRTRRA